MKAILLYGLTATGKSTFCKYVNEKYKYKIVQVRRLFENIIGEDKAATVYHELLEKTKSRFAWLELISADISNLIENQQIVIIEGLFTIEESVWFNNFSDTTIVYLENNKEHERTLRFCDREQLELDAGKIKLKNSDLGRITAGVPVVKDYADYIINNDQSLQDLYKAIDNFISKICKEQESNKSI